MQEQNQSAAGSPQQALEQIVAARAELGADASAAAITQHIYRDVSPFLLTVAEQSTLVALRYLDRLDRDGA